MGEVLPMPRIGDVFADVRGGGRTMRVSYHGDQRAVVVSLWVGTVCRGTFRMAAGDVSKLMSTLNEIKGSVDSAAATSPGPRGSSADAAGLGSEVTAVRAPRPSEPTSEQTGDITGTVNRSVLPVVRVA
jgi:hypothetical protein